MIQRVQSIYMAVAALVIAVPMVFDSAMASALSDSKLFELSLMAISSGTEGSLTPVLNSFALGGVWALGLLFVIYAIAQFKNRTFQLKLVRLAIAVQIADLVLLFYYIRKMSGLTEDAVLHYTPFLAIPAICAVLLVLAAGKIKKDEELVRSADRLR